MTKFKLGAYIEAIADSRVGLYKVGAIAKVTRIVEPGMVGVTFTAGDFECPGELLVLENRFRSITNYSSTFTEKAAAGTQSSGHVSGSGLQNHSIGPIYPLCVVAYDTIGKPLYYTVENIEQNTRLEVGGILLKFVDFASAYMVALSIGHHGYSQVNWASR